MRTVRLLLVGTAFVFGTLGGVSRVSATCVGAGPDGVVQGDEQCDDGNFNNSDCCNSDCTNPCDTFNSCRNMGCTLPGGVRTCDNSSKPSGTVCQDDGNSCTSDLCDSHAHCKHNNLANGTSCFDDSNACTADVCNNGVCDHNQADCNDGNACTTDGCNVVTGACTHTYLGDGATCQTDACHTAGTCSVSGCSPGSVITCTPDGDPCTSDYCDDVQGCIHPVRPGCAPSGCDGGGPDGVVTGAEQCDDGNFNNSDCCKSDCTFACDDFKSCTTDSCTLSGGVGVCSHTNLPVNTACASDGNPCTNDICKANGVCDHKNLADGTACQAGGSDGNNCTDDICINAACTHPAKNCADTDPCTDDICNASDGSCSNPPKGDGASCNTDACHTAGTCTGGACSPGSVITCPHDSNPCTSDLCEASLGCINDPKHDNAPCDPDNGGDDGNGCTTDVCHHTHCDHSCNVNATCDQCGHLCSNTPTPCHCNTQ